MFFFDESYLFIASRQFYSCIKAVNNEDEIDELSYGCVNIMFANYYHI